MANEGGIDIGRAVQGLGIGERMVLAGAAGVVALWLVFDLVLQEYFISQLPIVLAAFALLVAFRVRVQSTRPVLSYDVVLLVCAVSLGIIGVLSVVENIRSEVFEAGGATVVGAILFWIATLVAGAGAIQLMQQRD